MTDLCLYAWETQEIGGISIYTAWQDLRNSLRNSMYYDVEEGSVSPKPCPSTTHIFPAAWFQTQCKARGDFSWKAKTCSARPDCSSQVNEKQGHSSCEDTCDDIS